MANRVVLTAIFFWAMMANPAKATTAEFVNALSPQLRQFLRDHVAASNYLTGILDVQTSVRSLGIEYTNDLRGTTACHVSPKPDLSVIWICKDQQPIDEYLDVVFELFNSSHEEKFRKVEDEARAKRISRRNFVKQIVKIEYESHAKLKSDLPLLKFSAKDIAASSNYEYGFVNGPGNFEDFFSWVKNGSGPDELPKTWDYGVMYDSLIGRDWQLIENLARGGFSLLQLEKWDEAIKKFKAVTRLAPEDAVSFYYLGKAFFEKGDTNAALENLTESIHLDDEFAMTYQLRARTYRAMGRYRESIMDYREAIRITPKDNLLRTGLAWTYLKRGDRTNAFSLFQGAIDMDPKDSEAYVMRGHAFLEIGDWTNAMKDYTHGCDIVTNGFDALVNLAWLQACCPSAAIRNGAKAVVNARKACETFSWTNGVCLSTLAAAYAEQRDFTQAIKWQQKAISLGGAIMETNSQGENLLQSFQAKKPWRIPDPDTAP